jgi:centromeric protein E
MSHIRKRTKSVDEMSKMLDEMIHERVESGQIVRGNRGSVRVASDKKRESSAEPPIQLHLLAKHRASMLNESTAPVALEA